MKHLPTILVILFSCLLLTFAAGYVTSCRTDQLPIQTQATLAELEAEVHAVGAELAEAQESGNAEHIAAAEARLEDLEARIAKAVADGAAENTHSIFGALGLSGFVPGGPLLENAVAALAWLAFPRPRKHAVKVLKGFNPFDRTVSPYDALRSIPAAFGLTHSSGVTAEAFRAEEAAKTA